MLGLEVIQKGAERDHLMLPEQTVATAKGSRPEAKRPESLRADVTNQWEGPGPKVPQEGQHRSDFAGPVGTLREAQRGAGHLWWSFKAGVPALPFARGVVPSQKGVHKSRGGVSKQALLHRLCSCLVDDLLMVDCCPYICLIDTRKLLAGWENAPHGVDHQLPWHKGNMLLISSESVPVGDDAPISALEASARCAADRLRSTEAPTAM